MERQYKVVFRGTKKRGTEEEQIKHKVTKLLRISHTECDKLFSDPNEVVMKRRIDLPRAEKLQQLFARVGVYCEVLPCSALGLNPGPTEINSLFICHNCGFKKSLARDERPPERCPHCITTTGEYKVHKSTHLESKQIKENLKAISEGESSQRNFDPVPLQKKSLVRGKIVLSGLLTLLIGITLFLYLSEDNEFGIDLNQLPATATGVVNKPPPDEQ
ncbi:MAG: hypothetical protein ROD09_14245 [Candidatus Sedimenticola sp. (ex Thyasira tokunagai)]